MKYYSYYAENGELPGFDFGEDEKDCKTIGYSYPLKDSLSWKYHKQSLVIDVLPLPRQFLVPKWSLWRFMFGPRQAPRKVLEDRDEYSVLYGGFRRRRGIVEHHMIEVAANSIIDLKDTIKDYIEYVLNKTEGGIGLVHRGYCTIPTNSERTEFEHFITIGLLYHPDIKAFEDCRSISRNHNNKWNELGSDFEIEDLVSIFSPIVDDKKEIQEGFKEV